MKKYDKNPKDTMGNNSFNGCLNEEFVQFFVDTSLPFCAFQIGITHPDENYYISRKKNSAFIVEYIVSGKGYLHIDGTTHQLSAGDVYIITPGKRHYYGADKSNPYEKIWINFTSDMFVNILYSLSIYDKTVFKESFKCKKYFDNILDIANRSDEFDNVNTEILKEIFSLVADLAVIKNDVIPGDDFDRRAYRILSRAYSNTKIKDLAAHLCVSEVYLIKKFKKTYGVTPYQFLLSKKISAAKTMLKTTKLSVKEISKQLSFQNEHYFSDIFKQKTGMSPSEYRTRK